MKISELIQKLTDIKESKGDLPVAHALDDWSWPVTDIVILDEEIILQ